MADMRVFAELCAERLCETTSAEFVRNLRASLARDT